ncbi:HAD family phosphatase [Candidatus Collierbacteria bacterium]|nr:HAD family phosphatase [Candidatus Collierbacteria bacterium]
MKGIEYDPLIRQTNEKLGELGVKGGLFDLDDALIYTSEIFRRFMAEYADAVAASSGVDRTDFARRLAVINDEEYVTGKVNPNRWNKVAARLAGEFSAAADSIISNLSILFKIYTTEPRLRSGALGILSGLRAGGIKIGVVTHSNEDWAFWKLKMTGIIEYQDAVVVADQDRDKTSEHWRKCAKLLGVAGSNCLVFGDNLKGDIISGMSIGARGMWMPSPWLVYREGEVPEGVVQIGELDEFWDGVSRLT